MLATLHRRLVALERAAESGAVIWRVYSCRAECVADDPDPAAGTVRIITGVPRGPEWGGWRHGD
jgi:hypothetical protein